ncbi:MAG: hypothetical protein P8188_11845 [Gemmatimonadota bacterium]
MKPAEKDRFGVDPWSATFRNGEVEERFRIEALRFDRRQFLLALLLLNISSVTFLFSDIDFTGGVGPEFTLLLALRAGLVVLSAVVAVVAFRRVAPASLDWGVLIWTLYLCMQSLVIGTTRPLDYGPRVILDAFLVLVIYLLVPNRLTFQLIPGVLLTAGASLWGFFAMTLPAPSIRAGLTALVTSNIFGAWTSWRSHVDRRKRFGLLSRERELRHALQEAREAREVLERLVPICAACKSVRDDEGYWRTVEQYLVEATGLELTHGICPDCEERLYGEYLERGSDTPG